MNLLLIIALAPPPPLNVWLHPSIQLTPNLSRSIPCSRSRSNITLRTWHCCTGIIARARFSEAVRIWFLHLLPNSSSEASVRSSYLTTQAGYGGPVYQISKILNSRSPLSTQNSSSIGSVTVMEETASLRSTSLAGTTVSAGTKRKRATEPKFYAVRVGYKPGIYHTWADCLEQVKGFKKALCEILHSS